MVQTEAHKIDYLSRVFSGLSMEKKDNILDIARSLLHIQEHDLGGNQSLIAENTLFLQMKGKGQESPQGRASYP